MKLFGFRQRFFLNCIFGLMTYLCNRLAQGSLLGNLVKIQEATCHISHPEHFVLR